MANKSVNKIGSILANILGSVLSPIRRGIGTGIETGLTLGGATPQQKTQAQIDLPKFLQLKQSERQELQQKPVLSLGKTLAGNIALATPAGKGVGGMTKTGVVGGALGGFGASEQGQEVSSTLGGAAIGGVLGAGLGTLGKVKDLFKSTSQAGANLRTSVRAPKVSASPFAVEEQQAISNTLSELGAKGSASNQIKELPTIFRNLDTQVDDALKVSTIKVPKINIKDTVSSSIDDLVNFNPKDTAFVNAKSKFLDIIDKTGGQELSEKAIVDLKRSLNKNNQMSRIFTRLEKGTTPLTASEEVALATWQSLDDLLSGTVKDLTRKQSVLYKAAPGLISQSTKGGLNIPVIGKTGGQTIQAGKDLLGQVLQKAGKIGNVIPQTPQGAVAPARNLMLQGILNAGEGQTSEQVPIDQTQPVVPTTDLIPAESVDISKLPPEKQTAAKMIQEAKAAAQSGTMGGVGEITPQQAMMAQVLLSPKELIKFNNMYKIQQDTAKASKPKTMSSAAAKDLSRNQTAKSAIAQLETLLKNDKSNVLKAAIPGSLGARQYRSLWGSILDTIGTNRTGAAYTTEQRKDYKHLLPVFGDSEKTIEMKMTNIKNEIDNYVNNMQGTNNSDLDEQLQILQQQGINL